MPILTLRRRRGLVPGRGISSLADVPADPHSKVLHLCRTPRNAAPSAAGTANGAGIPLAAPGDPRGLLPARLGDTVLNVGCGTGYVLAAAAGTKAWPVVGIDASAQMPAVAADRVPARVMPWPRS